MPTAADVKILYCLAWALAGVVWAVLSFWWLRSGVEKIAPQHPSTQPLIALALTKLVRLAVLAGLIYLALQMHIIYALCLVFAASIGRWVRVILYHSDLKRTPTKEEEA
jgi:hypothetical protein